MASITLNADWGTEVRVSDGATFPGDGSDTCGFSSPNTYRVVNKFDITSLPTDATVTGVSLEITVIDVSAPDGPSVVYDLDGYNGTGQGDPETDSGPTVASGCNVAGVYLNDTTQFQTTGTKNLDLGATAVSDVQAARAAGTNFSVAIKTATEPGGTDANCSFDEYATPTTNPKLTITYTPAGGGSRIMWRGV